MTSSDSSDGKAPTDPVYWAFISYSQRDVKWASWLQTLLETYRIPAGLKTSGDNRWIPSRLFPIFRDRDELPSAPDLAEKIREALRLSRTLIVICSPNSARSPWVDQEVREFKALGRADRIFPIIIAGEPYATDHPGSADEECFPPAIRFVVAPDGTITSKRAEPIAADARPGKDGPRHAALKLIAGILGVGFDTLRRRDAVRQRRQRRLKIAAACGTALLTLLAYLTLADADLNVPGGTEIRRQLDRLRISVVRPVSSDSVMARNAASARTRIRRRLIEAVKISDLDRTAWGMGQMLTALYGDQEATIDELSLLPPLVKDMFDGTAVQWKDGVPQEWNDGYSYPRAEAPVWMLMALSAALSHPQALSEAERTNYLRYLEIAQQIGDQFRLENGGWRVVTRGDDPQPYIYSSAIALHALLDLDAAGLGWHGDRETLKTLIEHTADALKASFRDDPSAPGWGRAPNDDKISDGNLTILVLSSLGRAHLEAGVTIPSPIEAAAIHHLTGLYRRTYFPTNEDILFQDHYLVNGQKQFLAVPTRVMWYPWSNKALTVWIEYVERNGRPVEIHQALRRSQSHLLTTLIAEMEREMAGAMLFVAAENAYGLQSSRGKSR
ncbi:MAG: toll/interleukin-1 receptor domain-containing protein [Planctomycetaceae bacterium]